MNRSSVPIAYSNRALVKKTKLIKKPVVKKIKKDTENGKK